MKMPLPDEAKDAIKRTTDDLTVVRQELTEIRNLLQEILDTLRSS